MLIRRRRGGIARRYALTQQFLADTADHLMPISVTKRQIYDNQAKRGQAAQGTFLFQQHRSRPGAGSRQRRGDAGNASSRDHYISASDHIDQARRFLNSHHIPPVTGTAREAYPPALSAYRYVQR